MLEMLTVVVPTTRRVPALTITPIDGEARILDTVLAEHLGMANIYKIRELIRGHAEELQSFGELSPQRGETSAKGGRPSEAYYLNRQQALLICILSKTEKAKLVRAEVIRRFDAFEELTRPAPVLRPVRRRR